MRSFLAAAGLGLALLGTPIASADDSINLVDEATPQRITAFPQGSSFAGPVNAFIDSLVLDANDVNAILDHVALLANVQGPIFR